ncbi:hypothetical protein OIU74_002892 [Salix koriyanagi]|uniref:Uncharacterized protein n=1 Tax=Salix koriyanagi TaxID=2511006 RepID=A0A9Q0UWM9_9ROSI|nr:hypothetical protein OIU74_002892 [Salix koriyanagi]
MLFGGRWERRGVWFRAVVFRPPWGRSFRLQAEKEVSVPWSFFQRWNAFWGWALDVVFGLGASMLFWALGFDLAVWEDAGFSAWAWFLGSVVGLVGSGLDSFPQVRCFGLLTGFFLFGLWVGSVGCGGLCGAGARVGFVSFWWAGGLFSVSPWALLFGLWRAAWLLEL